MRPIYEFEEQKESLNNKFAAYLDGKSIVVDGRSCLHDSEPGNLLIRTMW